MAKETKDVNEKVETKDVNEEVETKDVNEEVKTEDVNEEVKTEDEKEEVLTKKEKKRIEALEKATKLLKDKSKEEANKYIEENMKITDITKGFISAYIRKYATEKDKEWFKKDFRKASTKKVKKQVSTIVMGENNTPVYKKDKKGNIVPKRKRVDSITGEVYERFDISGARKEFIDHFDIITKANDFVVKEERKVKYFDEFDGLFE